MKSFVLIAVMLVAALVVAETVTVQNCQDAQCTTGCQTQQFTAGQCLSEADSSNTVELTCPGNPTMCNDLKIYQDASCADESQMALFNNACNSCQQNFTISCGALHDAIFFAVNCTDVACQDCGGAIIVPFKKCTHVAPWGYAYVTKVTGCTGVTLTTYNGTSCTGGTYTQQYGSGQCFDGTLITCD